MKTKPVLSVVLLAHHPLAGAAEESRQSRREMKSGKLKISASEAPLFQAILETWIPLLETLTRLEQDAVPYRLAIALSPLLCGMLQDCDLNARFISYLDKKIEFGRKELDRNSQDPELQALSRYYYEADVERRIFYTERCNMNLLDLFRQFQATGKVELLTTAASYAFLPFYASRPEVISSQIETALVSHRRMFGKNPDGFWLPEFGWDGALEPCLKTYGFTYTMVTSHGMVLGNPPAAKGSFYPAKSKGGLVFLGRDFTAAGDLETLLAGDDCSGFRNRFTDAGFELSLRALKPFIGRGKERCATGFRYHDGARARERRLYNPEEARQKAASLAREFLALRIKNLQEAQGHLAEPALSLCAFDSLCFGSSWYEGPAFLETLLREGAKSAKVELSCPADYIEKQGAFPVCEPEFSSWGEDGYAANWLDASNDWMYRHVFRAVQRMSEMTERFPNDTGLKERALNQAARELFLAMGADWPRMLNQGRDPEYARSQIEEALRNFTTIYESLGSNYISTERLTDLERRRPVFPFINYRMLARQKQP
jgi:1,4-alpha-glucan branching enzyme